ncbi:MAG: RNA polymerase sigma factor [Chloroflexota bacterium]|jgi:RNA polymerase sigma-70 factor (ECF subfamily)
MHPSHRSNPEWLEHLRAEGEIQAHALQDLRAIIYGGLLQGLGGYASSERAEISALIEETTQETLLRVLDRLDTFEGRSQFTTWVYKIAIRLAFSELRRRRWKDVSLEANLEAENGAETPPMAEPADEQTSPERLVEQRDLTRLLHHLIRTELTAKQRVAFTALVLQDMPMEVTAEKMGMQRNALYKLLHDGRKHLKRRLQAHGLTAEDVLAIFEKKER